MAGPTIQDVLLEANRLLGLGLHQAASDILNDYLAQDSENKYALRGLARIRLLQGRPRDVIPLLLRALGRSPRGQEATLSPNPSAVNEVCTDEAPRSDASFADLDFAQDASGDILAQRRGQGYFPTLADDLADAIVGSALQKATESIPVPTTSAELPSDLPFEQRTEAGFSGNEDFAQAEELQKEFEDQPEILAALLEVEGDIEVPESAPDEVRSTEELEGIEAGAHLDWEAFEPEGADYEEAPTREELAAVEVQDVRRTQRARQVALGLGLKYGWDSKGVSLLTSIFERYWWNAAKRSLERELELGLTPRELKLAWEIRDVWTQHPQFSSNFSYSGYLNRYLSWPAALEVVRSFGGTPDVAEIEQLLLTFHARWYSSQHLIERFLAFIQYVRHRCRETRHGATLEPWIAFESLDSSAYDLSNDDPVDALNEGDWDELKQLGVHRDTMGACAERDVWRRVEDYDEIEEQLNPLPKALRRRHQRNDEAYDD